MRAVWYERAGPAAQVLQFGDWPDPEPGPGEVLVRVACSAVNPTDVKRRQTGRELGQFSPIIPNNDGSGTIEAVGADVDPARIGERVWLFAAQAARPHGTAAELVALPSRQAIRLPDHEEMEAGACLGVPAVTAHHGLFAGGAIEGRNVLVTGGAGRVGRYAVQMAKWAGARVLATAGTPEKVEHVRALGADAVVNHRDGDLAEAVRAFTGGTGVDRVVEVAFGANVDLLPDIVAPNGVVASYASDAVPRPELPFQQLMYRNVTIRPFSIYGLPRDVQDRAFADVTRWLREARPSHLIGGRMALTDMVYAHESIERGDVFGVLLLAP